MRPVPLPGIGSSVIRSKRAQGPSRSATNSSGPTGQGYIPPSPYPIYSLASSSKQNTANASPRPGTLTVSGFERASGLRHATQNPGSLLIAVTFSFRRYPPRTITLEDRPPLLMPQPPRSIHLLGQLARSALTGSACQHGALRRLVSTLRP